MPEPASVADQVEHAHRHAEGIPAEQRDGLLRALLPPRSTLLNPLRPSRDLLEHLVDGIRSSPVLYREVTLDERIGNGPTDVDGPDDAVGVDAESDDYEQIDDEFSDEV